jgi:hypothetical protein
MSKTYNETANWRTYNAKVSGMLGASDIGEFGCDDRIVIISGFSQGKLKTKENPRGVSKLILELSNSEGKPAFLDVDGLELRWPINSTNGEALERLLGSGVPARWIGRVVALWVDRFDDRMSGKSKTTGKFDQINGIRVRPVLPKQDAAWQAKLKAAGKSSAPSQVALPAATAKVTGAAAALPPINSNNDDSQTYSDEPPDNIQLPGRQGT